MEKYRRASDKLQEAKHFIGEMREEINKYIGGVEPSSISRFRYSFSAFVTAARSVTLVLQKQYRSNFGDDFNGWYGEQLKVFEDFPFSRLFLELRNIAQKEGNKYPLFLFEFTSNDGSIYLITWDPLRNKLGEIIEAEIASSEEANVSFTIPKGSSEEDFIAIIIQGLDKTLKSVLSKEKIESWKKTSLSLILDEKKTMLSSEDFFEICDQFVAKLEKIVTEAEIKF